MTHSTGRIDALTEPGEAGNPAARAQSLSRLYHENSKLTPRRALGFIEQMDAFSTEPMGRTPSPFKHYPTRKAVDLPKASKWRGGARLFATLRARRSHRGAFARHPIRLEQLSTLLELAFGMTGTHPDSAGDPATLRTWPSAGALYPLELYVATLNCRSLGRHLHHYDVPRHRLAQVGPCPPPDELARLIFTEGSLEGAGALVILTRRFERGEARYGERAYRFALSETGHVAQNILLLAEALDLGAVPLGGFCEDELGDHLGLDARCESPLYVVMLGRR